MKPELVEQPTVSFSRLYPVNENSTLTKMKQRNQLFRINFRSEVTSHFVFLGTYIAINYYSKIREETPERLQGWLGFDLYSGI
jgi:hypothetical protein